VKGDCKTPCRLFCLKGKEKALVAKGYVFTYDPLQQVKVHGIPLHPGCCKVEVSHLYKNEYANVKVPIPTAEVTYVKEAVKTFVQWPQNLISVVISEVNYNLFFKYIN
jgi:hypothetical protein